MHPWEKMDRPTSNHKEQVFNGNETLTDYKLKKAPLFFFKNSNNLRLIEFFSSCRPAARLHPAGLVRGSGRGDGDLLWGRLPCLLPGQEHVWTSLRLLQPRFGVLADDDDVRWDRTRHPCRLPNNQP